MIWNGNEIVLICSLAIKIHSDVTPSYAMMRSDRRGLWWICNEFKPLPAYTTMVVSLWFSFADFSQVFPMRDYRVYIEWCARWWFLSKYFPNGVSGFIVQCAIQSSNLRFGIPSWLEGRVWWHCWEVITRAIRIAKLNGWLWRSDGESVWVLVLLERTHW
jgi:hypothetical protein